VSVVTEYFVASEQDVALTFAGWQRETHSLPPPGPAAAGEASSAPDLSRFARAILRGISPTELVALRAAALPAEVSEPERERPREMPLTPPVPGRAQWVRRLDRDLVARLAALTPAETDEVGERWAAAELTRIDTIEDDAVRFSRRAHHRVRFWQDVLSELVTLATFAEEKREGLYLYMRM